jgi:hypothetical protein
MADAFERWTYSDSLLLLEQIGGTAASIRSKKKTTPKDPRNESNNPFNCWIKPEAIS